MSEYDPNAGRPPRRIRIEIESREVADRMAILGLVYQAIREAAETEQRDAHVRIIADGDCIAVNETASVEAAETLGTMLDDREARFGPNASSGRKWGPKGYAEDASRGAAEPKTNLEAGRLERAKAYVAEWTKAAVQQSAKISVDLAADGVGEAISGANPGA